MKNKTELYKKILSAIDIALDFPQYKTLDNAKISLGQAPISKYYQTSATCIQLNQMLNTEAIYNIYEKQNTAFWQKEKHE